MIQVLWHDKESDHRPHCAQVEGGWLGVVKLGGRLPEVQWQEGGEDSEADEVEIKTRATSKAVLPLPKPPCATSHVPTFDCSQGFVCDQGLKSNE